MNASPIRRLAGALATFAAVAALAAPAALADPQTHYRPQLPQTQPGLTHVPEIVSGLASSPQGRPSPQPEVISGIASPGYHGLAGSVAEPSQRGFDWGDAGIGAAVALAAAALASGCALALRKRVSLVH